MIFTNKENRDQTKILIEYKEFYLFMEKKILSILMKKKLWHIKHREKDWIAEIIKNIFPQAKQLWCQQQKQKYLTAYQEEAMKSLLLYWWALITIPSLEKLWTMYIHPVAKIGEMPIITILDSDLYNMNLLLRWKDKDVCYQMVVNHEFQHARIIDFLEKNIKRIKEVPENKWKDKLFEEYLFLKIKSELLCFLWNSTSKKNADIQFENIANTIQCWYKWPFIKDTEIFNKKIQEYIAYIKKNYKKIHGKYIPNQKSIDIVTEKIYLADDVPSIKIR
jgi:hypothetical protein